MHTAYNSKDYAKAISLMNEWFYRYDKLSPGFKKNNPGYLPGMDYNMACYTAMNRQKAKAIAYLQKAVDAGYSNYANTLIDSDMNSLRDDKDFKIVLNKLRERGDYGYILKNSGSYNKKQKIALPVFT